LPVRLILTVMPACASAARACIDFNTAIPDPNETAARLLDADRAEPYARPSQ
jgi:hypothetical protein